jgi:histidine triad (HIT) family protein
MCIFCRIIKKELPSTVVYEDDEIIAIEDIVPAAPVHILIMPKRHINTINDLSENEDTLIGKMHRIAAAVAKEKGIAESGYRVVANCNSDGGQEVFHIHIHLIGGRKLGRIG